MGKDNSTWSDLWKELQRRHVVRVTLGYAAVAFVILQMGEIILPAFTDNAVWLRLLVVLAALLLPVVIVLAWIYEVTPAGIRPMSEIDMEAGHVSEVQPVYTRFALLFVTLGVVGTAGWWAITDTMERSRLEGSATPARFTLAEYDPAQPIRSLAVLPLDVLSEGEESGDFFAAGMHEAIIAQLSQLPALRVVSRTSVLGYAERSAPIPLVGAELGVDAVIEGTVTRVGSDVRITVHVIHAASETHVMTRTYDGRLENILQLQSEIADEIVREIQGELLPEEQQTLMAYRDVSEDPEANEQVLRGRDAAARGTEESLRRADEYFQRAIEEDPDFAPAYAERARVQLELGMLSGDTADFRQVITEASELANHAFQLDSGSADVQAVWGFISEFGEGAPSSATAIPAPRELDTARPPVEPARETVTLDEAEQRRVVVVGDSAIPMRVLETSGTVVSALGRKLESRFGDWAARLEGAVSFSTADAMIHGAEALAGNGQPDRALALLEKVVRERPDYARAWIASERILAREGRFGEIVDLRRGRAEAMGENSFYVDDLAERLDRSGPEGYWRWRIEELERLRALDRPASRVDLAIAYMRIDDSAAALDQLEQAAAERDPRLLRERDNPAFDGLRGEPRFRRLLSRLGHVRETGG